MCISGKKLSKLGIGRNFLHLTMGIFEKRTANAILSDERLEAFSPKMRNATRMFAFTTAIDHGTGGSKQCSGARKGSGRMQTRQEAALSLFTGNPTVRVENPVGARTLLEVSEAEKQDQYIKKSPAFYILVRARN